VHFLVKGKVKIIDNSDLHNELVKDILTEPDIFGDLGLEGKLNNDESAEALTANTIVCSFHVSDFKRILEENPSIVLSYAKNVNSKLQRLENRHADLVFRDTKDRLIRFIKQWARTDGNRMGDKIILNNYLTHSDIAGFIATSRQSVNMLLNELRSSGLLRYNRKHIELNNPVAWN
jgi:CRP/FNR family cyclic AMP-dependent transcriptional regulator